MDKKKRKKKKKKEEKKKKKETCPAREVRRNGIQRAKNFSINERAASARQARARARCKRQAQKHS